MKLEAITLEHKQFNFIPQLHARVFTLPELLTSAKDLPHESHRSLQGVADHSLRAADLASYIFVNGLVVTPKLLTSVTRVLENISIIYF